MQAHMVVLDATDSQHHSPHPARPVAATDTAEPITAQLCLVPAPTQQITIAPLDPASAAKDVVKMLLESSRSTQTRRAYQVDLTYFFAYFQSVYGTDRSETTPGLTPAQVAKFLALPKTQIAIVMTEYKIKLLKEGKAEATVNRRLAAIRSLLKLASRLGFCDTDGHGLVDSEKIQSYRDTKGISVELLQQLLQQPAILHREGSARALRDEAILTLMVENGLRRNEIRLLDVGDFSFSNRSLAVLGKGKGTQKQLVTISDFSAMAIRQYVLVSGHFNEKGPLFRNLHRDPATNGARLTGNGLWWLVCEYGEAIGVPELRPHKLRHSCITAALDLTGGDVRSVQRLSRHSDLRTLTKYDDNREDLQGAVTVNLSGVVHGKSSGNSKTKATAKAKKAPGRRER